MLMNMAAPIEEGGNFLRSVNGSDPYRRTGVAYQRSWHLVPFAIHRVGASYPGKGMRPWLPS